MEREVIIYVLIDPISLKVRYIGRTSCKLKKRLAEHISKAKKDYDRTHKVEWIRSLLRINSKPFIRKLITIKGWGKSYEVERCLISKYKDRLLNHNDRGEGNLNKIVTIEQRIAIASSLIEYFKTHNAPACKKVYAYNEDGTFHSEYKSIRDASKQFGLYYKTVSRHANNIIGAKKPNRKKDPTLKKGKQFSFEKVDKMFDYTLKS